MNAPASRWHTTSVTNDLYRALPKVDELVDGYEGPLPRSLLVNLVRSAIADARAEISAGKTPDARLLVEAALRRAERSAGVRMVNASGVLLHTNLGRASWSEAAIGAAETAARSPSNLELDVDTGSRSRRGSYVGRLVAALTGAEDVLVVNNNASAVMLALAALASGSAVPVARGELIEIGGSYRLPEVMEASGATLVEVGTTNRTRPGDYQTALQVHRGGAVLVVHPSNYKVEGFVSSPSVEELSTIAGEFGVPLIYDIGSGLLDAETPWIDGPTPKWLLDEPAVRQTLAAGADLVTFSGDKLLGGPQAGIIAGQSEAIARLRSHPLARALRVDGVTYASLGATLEAYDGDILQVPFWRQAMLPFDHLEVRANNLAREVFGVVEAGTSTVGAGSAPGAVIPSPLVRLEHRDDIYERLLERDVPVLTRRDSGSLLIDLRTVSPEDDSLVAEAVSECL